MLGGQAVVHRQWSVLNLNVLSSVDLLPEVLVLDDDVHAPFCHLRAKECVWQYLRQMLSTQKTGFLLECVMHCIPV